MNILRCIPASIAFLFLAFCFGFSKYHLSSVKKIGIFDRDSVHAAYPAYAAALDSSAKYDTYMDKQITVMTADLIRRKTEYDSLQMYWSPLIKELKMKEMKDLRKNIDNFSVYSDSCKVVRKKQLMDGVDFSIDEAAEKVRKKDHLDAVKDRSEVFVLSPDCVVRNVTPQIIAQLKR